MFRDCLKNLIEWKNSKSSTSGLVETQRLDFVGCKGCGRGGIHVQGKSAGLNTLQLFGDPPAEA